MALFLVSAFDYGQRYRLAARIILRASPSPFARNKPWLHRADRWKPDDIKAQTDTSTEGEASLRGHLQGDAGKEQTSSQSYVPPDQNNDKALNMAEDLLRSIKINPAFPPSAKNASSQN
jgi:hypothetical protein